MSSESGQTTGSRFALVGGAIGIALIVLYLLVKFAIPALSGGAEGSLKEQQRRQDAADAIGATVTGTEEAYNAFRFWVRDTSSPRNA